MRKTNEKNNNGITLIALIITIIVMLILVSVTITMAVNGGLFNYARKAVGETNKAREAEQELANLEANMTADELIDKYTGESTVDPNLINIGDYISNYPVEYTNVASRAYANPSDSDSYPDDAFIGWRVLAKETDDQGNVLYLKLISAGVPINFKQYDKANISFSALTTNFLTTEITNTPTNNKFYNCGFKNVTGTTLEKTFENQFTDKVQAFTYIDLINAVRDFGDSKIPTLLNDSKYKNLLAIPCKGEETGRYAFTWLPKDNSGGYMMSIRGGSNVQDYTSADTYGIRVVIYLKPDVNFKTATEINGTQTWEITV